MTGYQEVVTDPSFAGQLITFTQPMIGNYGVEPEASESDGPHARAVDRPRGPKRRAEAAARASPTGSPSTGVVGLQGIDTRAITRRLRDGGRRARRGLVRDGDRRRGPGRGARGARDGRPGARGAGIALGRRRRSRPRAPSGRTSSSSTTASRARSSASCARRVRGSPSCRGTRRRTTCSPPRPTGSSSPTGRATPPRCRRASTRCAPCSRPGRCSGSASATSCSAVPSASRRSSCASDTAAPTIRCSTSTPAACS